MTPMVPLAMEDEINIVGVFSLLKGGPKLTHASEKEKKKGGSAERFCHMRFATNL
jgi:hypothetical protein